MLFYDGKNKLIKFLKTIAVNVSKFIHSAYELMLYLQLSDKTGSPRPIDRCVSLPIRHIKGVEYR